VVALASLNEDPSDPVRASAIQALARIGDDAAAGALSRFLQDGQAALRLDALLGLEKVGSPMAMAFVGELFQHADGDLRATAIQVLRREGRRHPEIAARQLVGFVHDPRQDVQLGAIAYAGETGHGEAVAGLIDLARSQEARVRREAVGALEHVRDVRAADALARFSNDSDVEVRVGAFNGLARVGGSRGLQVLLEGLKDPEARVRETVISQVAKLRLGLAVQPLTDQLPAANLQEQRAIIGALGQIPTTEAKAALLELAVSGDTFQKIMAEKALGQQDLANKDLEQSVQDFESPRM
jgi:HEAT repeat protein